MLTGNATMASREMISAAWPAGPPKDVTSSDTTTPTTTAAAPPVSQPLSCSRLWSVSARITSIWWPTQIGRSPTGIGTANTHERLETLAASPAGLFVMPLASTWI